MKVVIDTSSLMSLVRYYLPFDQSNILYQFIQQKIEDGELIIIDKVYTECEYNSKGAILNSLTFLKDKEFLKSFKVPYKTDSLIVPNTKMFFHQLNSEFVNNTMRKKLTDVEFESEKTRFLESADLKQVILALNIQKSGEEVILVTEETESSNDNKTFKKIPAIAKVLNIETMTLPMLIAKYEGIDIIFNK